MKYVTYRGALYTKAHERIRELRSKNRPYSLITSEELLTMDSLNFWKIKATLTFLDTQETYTGSSLRRYEKDHPFGSYPLEWAETIATARAIGKAGIGIDFSYACLEELGELNQREVTEREGGDVPAVELTSEVLEIKVEELTAYPVMKKDAFTKEDMKEMIGMKEPAVVITEPEMTNVNIPHELTKSEKLAQKMREMREAREKGKKRKVKKVKKTESRARPEPVEYVKPVKSYDKFDNILQSMED